MIRQGVCKAGKRGFLRGVHQPSDNYKIALFTSSANLGPDTKSYSPIGEAKGQGYEAGGLSLASVRYGDDEATMGWTSSPRWPVATIRARGALIYNATRDNAALLVLDFGEDKISSVGPWFINDGELVDVMQLL